MLYRGIIDIVLSRLECSGLGEWCWREEGVIQGQNRFNIHDCAVLS